MDIVQILKDAGQDSAAAIVEYQQRKLVAYELAMRINSMTADPEFLQRSIREWGIILGCCGPTGTVYGEQIAGALRKLVKPKMFGVPGEFAEELENLAEAISLFPGKVSEPLYGMINFEGPYYAVMQYAAEDEWTTLVFDDKVKAQEVADASKRWLERISAEFKR